jgi:sugar lactone lactonase YvrE
MRSFATLAKTVRTALPIAGALLLASCGGDNGYDCGLCGSTVSYSGTLSGMAAATSITLQDNVGSTTVLAANGAFSFSTSTPPWLPAMVGVLIQPSGQNCTVTNGSTNGSGIDTIAVACAASSGSSPVLSDYVGMLLAGSADGTGTAASFNNPTALATDSAGNVYVADTNNNTIRKIAAGGVVTTLAGAAVVYGSSDGTGASASFRHPYSVATDSAGNVYVADSDNNTIRKITPGGVVSTLAGTAGVRGSADGTGAAASFSGPDGLAVDSAGNVYVADYYNSTIRAITPGGAVTTLAGAAGSPGSADGTGAAARFNGPQGLATDRAGNVYLADSGNNTIRVITPAGVVTTLAGTAGVRGAADGAGTAATFAFPTAVAVDSSGDVYVADTGNATIRKVTAAGAVSTVVGVAGQDVFSAATLPGSLLDPGAVALSGTTLYIETNNGVAVVPNVP